MSSCHLGQYKGNFYIIDEVLIANLSPAKAPVTRMHFQIVPFSYLDQAEKGGMVPLKGNL